MSHGLFEILSILRELRTPPCALGRSEGVDKSIGGVGAQHSVKRNRAPRPQLRCRTALRDGGEWDWGEEGTEERALGASRDRTDLLRAGNDQPSV